MHDLTGRIVGYAVPHHRDPSQVEVEGEPFEIERTVWARVAGDHGVSVVITPLHSDRDQYMGLLREHIHTVMPAGYEHV